MRIRSPHDTMYGLGLYMLAFGLITDGTPIACRSCNGRLNGRVLDGALDRVLDPLISTKLRVPQARPKLVARPRLTERLNRESGRRLTLITAPAGGKTTLLGEWMAGRSDERSVAWASLDEETTTRHAFFPTWWPRSGRSKTDSERAFLLVACARIAAMEASTGALINELADIPASLARFSTTITSSTPIMSMGSCFLAGAAF